MPDSPDITGALWRKSSRSGANNNCVEVAEFDQVIGLRDSKDPGGPELMVSHGDWLAFASAVKAGELAG